MRRASAAGGRCSQAREESDPSDRNSDSRAANRRPIVGLPESAGPFRAVRERGMRYLPSHRKM
jgi:hypothetical protein